MRTYSLRLMAAFSTDHLVAVSLCEDVYVNGQRVTSDLLSLKNRDQQAVEDELRLQLEEMLDRLRRRGAMQELPNPDQDPLPLGDAHANREDSRQLHGTARFGH